MVLVKTTFIGAALIVAGVLLLTVVGPYITIQVQVSQRHDVESNARFRVDDVTDRQYTLPGSVAVSGTLNVAQAPTNQSDDIQFMIFDAQNYQSWATGQQSNYMFASDRQGLSNFTFNTPSSGVYHFVFDDRASPYKKYVTLSIGYDEVSVNYQPDPRVPYVAWGLLAIGLVVAIYGVLRRQAVLWLIISIWHALRRRPGAICRRGNQEGNARTP
jgi:hypothetical protein